MKRPVFLATSLLVALMLTTGCSKNRNEAPAVRSVLTQTVKGDDVAGVTTYPGRTQASEEANVAFRVAGTLLKVTVKELSQTWKQTSTKVM